MTRTPIDLDAFREWLISRGYAPSTADGYTAIVKRFSKSTHGAQAWLDARQEDSRRGSIDGLPTATVKRYQQALQALGEHLTGTRPAYQLPRYVRRAKPNRATELSREQAEAVRHALLRTDLREPTAAVTRLLQATGCRVGEALGLYLTEVQIDGGIGGGSDCKISVLLTRTKTRVDRRIPLLSDDAIALASYLEHRRPSSRHAHVFPSPKPPGAKPVSEVAVRTFCHELGLHLDIPRLHPHAFRHRMATSLLEAGVDIAVRRAILGHAPKDVTEGYQHPSEDVLRQALEQARRW